MFNIFNKTATGSLIQLYFRIDVNLDSVSLRRLDEFSNSFVGSNEYENTMPMSSALQ